MSEPTNASKSSSGSMKSRIKIAVIAALAIVTVIIILQNTEAVETKLLFFTLSMPRAVLIFVTYAAGAVSGLLLASRVGKSGKEKPANTGDSAD